MFGHFILILFVGGYLAWCRHSSFFIPYLVAISHGRFVLFLFLLILSVG